MRGDERAVSDVLAFIIVFSIIITSVALVYGTGFSSLDQVREGEQKANAERAFEAIAYSMDDIETGAATRRGGSLELGGALLQVDDSSSVNVTVNESGGPQLFAYENTTGSLSYTLDKTVIAYENGAVLRSDRGSSVDVQRASMTCTNDRAVVSLVLLRSDSNSLDSQGGVEISMEERETKLLYTDPDGSTLNNVTVEMTGTEFENGWNDAMAETGWDTSGGGPYECTDVENVVVRVTIIEVTYGSP
jgi:hypothetical protein